MASQGLSAAVNFICAVHCIYVMFYVNKKVNLVGVIILPDFFGKCTQTNFFAGHVCIHESCLPQHAEYRGTPAIWGKRCGIIQVTENYKVCVAWE